jgi:sphingomyelin phosphodiesterase acid-like 3
MNRLLPVFLLSQLSQVAVASSGISFGTFWQLTDIHYDSNYSSPLLAPSLCHSTEGLRNASTGTGVGGLFGDYNCDSPWALVESAISAMKSIEPHPDFILWTGDSVPHAPNSVLDQQKILVLMKNVTNLLQKTFPDIRIFPMLGNHDAWPSDQLPGYLDPYYEEVLKMTGWDKILKEEQLATFRLGGFYMVRFRSGLRLVCVNSNLWYYHDNSSANVTDPAGHFNWLELLMDDAHMVKDKVLLVGHVPPGVFGRSKNIAWFRPTFNWRFHALLQRHHETILAAIFGHEHADGFRVVFDLSGEPVIPMFMAPSVTPWYSTLPGVGSNNPGIRLYNYSKSSYQITDYSQYFVNLTAANIARRTDWALEYRASEAFGISHVDAASLADVISQFSSSSQSALFDKYYTYNSVGLDTSKCTGDCRRQQICAAAEIDLERYASCLSQQSDWQPRHHRLTTTVGPDDPRHQRHRRDEPLTYFLLGALITIIVVLFVILASCCCQRRHAIVFFGRSKYVQIREV